MATILRKLRFFQDPSTVAMHGQRIRVKSDQTIVWVSVSLPGQTVPVSTLAAVPRHP
jgi:hypothetical protein